MVNGENIGFKDEENLIQLPRGYTTDLEIARGIVYVTNKLNYLKGYDNTVKLKLIRKNIIIGIGCRKIIQLKQ